MTVTFNTHLPSSSRLMNSKTRFAASESNTALQIVQDKATVLTAHNIAVTGLGDDDTEATLRTFNPREDKLPSGAQCTYILETFGLAPNPPSSALDSMKLYLDANLTPVFAQQITLGQSLPAALADHGTQTAYEEGLKVLARPGARIYTRQISIPANPTRDLALYTTLQNRKNP